MQSYTLSTTVLTPDGNPVAGARLTATLDRPDYTDDGSVLPLRVSSVSDESGTASIDIFSNLDGTQDSRYVISVTQGSVLFLSAQVQMPRANTALENLVDITPITPEYSTAAALSAAQAQGAADLAVPAAQQAVEARDEAVPAAGIAVSAAAEAVQSAERINTLFWLGV